MQLCSHHKLLLAAGSPEETLRHSKSDEHATSQLTVHVDELGQEAGD